jgi:hypothetical protein
MGDLGRVGSDVDVDDSRPAVSNHRALPPTAGLSGASPTPENEALAQHVRDRIASEEIILDVGEESLSPSCHPRSLPSADLVDTRWRHGAVMVVALPCEPPEVVADEMAAQVEHAPTRARCPGGPSRPASGRQAVEGAVPAPDRTRRRHP